MVRHNFDLDVYDYTWKQNRLSKDKAALKASLMNVIQRKPKKTLGKDEDQGYKASAARAEERGTTQMEVSKRASNGQTAYNRGSEFKKGAQQILNN